ncbi:MAG: di-heme-cytochrome C peroxidase [Methylobacter sp.]|nr:di-heme-cytochrome C peroxidase [Methylobacter sp.]
MKKIEYALRTKCLAGTVLAMAMLSSLPSLAALPSSPVMTNQGWKWTDSARNKYYTEDQGSRVIPLKWINALKQADGAPFMADSLSRYGYLPNPKSPERGLPVGFIAAKEKGDKIMGLTCSACHTRQIDVSGTSYRIDGGPAITDIQQLFTDLDLAVDKVLKDPAAFTEFAKAVLGPSAKKADEDKLRADVDAWYLPYHTIMSRSLPTVSPWGPSRLDAVSMIFNRVSGLDIGLTAPYIIEENIKLADAPVRYPFVWNAPIQDTTQWPGFAPNGNRVLGLSRNLGEVFGVFAEFHPKKDDSRLLKINYVENNSANFHGLNKQESLIKKIGPPKWPWKLNKVLAAEGEKVFNKKDPNEDNESCADCHGIKEGKMRSFFHKTWATPMVDVGTDSREVNLLGSQVKTGVLEGATIFPNKPPLKAVDSAFSVLGTVVGGAILQHYLPVELTSEEQKAQSKLERLKAMFKKEIDNIEDLVDLPDLANFEDDIKKTLDKPVPDTANPFKYESRVLQGIWATAPYLHNGSVQSLAELLTPAEQRSPEFKVGPAYDPDKVGLAAVQTKFDFTLKTTGCKGDERNSGNSRCGHDYGTTFSDAEKKALLEYLKNL